MLNSLQQRAILTNIYVRKAVLSDQNDLDVLLCMIKSLAEFEGMKSPLDSTTLAKALENEFFAYIAFCDSVAVGSAVCRTYSTLMYGGVTTLYIEDLFVEKNFRHMGIGTTLFEKLKEVAKTEGYSKIEWKCLPENYKALEFYKKMGGTVAKDFLTFAINKFD